MPGSQPGKIGRVFSLASLLMQHREVSSRAFASLKKQGKPALVLWHGVGPGDDLLCSAVMHESAKRTGKKVWIFSRNPGLFEHNLDVGVVLPLEQQFMNQLGTRGMPPITHPIYGEYNAVEDRDYVADYHIIARMCEVAGLQGEISLRPYMTLTQEETRKGKLAEKQIVIQSSGNLTPAKPDAFTSQRSAGSKFVMRTKQWYPERFQQVADAVASGWHVIQLGAAEEPLLSGVTDLRGKTSIRESAAIIANSAAYVGQVGFLMHLARAVECRSVIVYGGREAPHQSGYSSNVNVCGTQLCSPCWYWNKCTGVTDMACMQEIDADQVIAGLQQVIELQGTPLAEDRITLPTTVATALSSS